MPTIVACRTWCPLSSPPGARAAGPNLTLVVDDELQLRPWSEADTAAVVDAFSCPDIQRWHLRRFDDREEAPAGIRGWADCWRSGSDASWAVCRWSTRRTTGRRAGWRRSSATHRRAR